MFRTPGGRNPANPVRITKSPNRTGTVATEDLGSILRGLRLDVREEQLEDLVNEVDPEGTGSVELAEIEHLLASCDLPSSPDFEEIVSFFAPFDRWDDGHVDAAELVEALRTRGEPLSEEDVARLMQEATIDGDKRINIRDFVRHMLDTSE